ncbi:hypothetical protein EV122DRAFT_216074 [Schizophyllum commune]
MPTLPNRRTPSSTALLRIIGRLDVHGGTTRTGGRASAIRRIRRTPTVKRRLSTLRRRPHTIARLPLLARAIPHAHITLAALFHTRTALFHPRTDTLIYVRVDAADVTLPALQLAVAVAEEGRRVVAEEGAPVIASTGIRIVCEGARAVCKGAHTRRASIPPHATNALSCHAGGPCTLRPPIDPQVAAVAVGRGECPFTMSPRQRLRFASDWLLKLRKCEFLTLRKAIPLVVTRRWTLLPDDGSRYALDSSPWPPLGRFPRD